MWENVSGVADGSFTASLHNGGLIARTNENIAAAAAAPVGEDSDAGGAGVFAPAFTMPSPPVKSFILKPPEGVNTVPGGEEIDFNASRAKWDEVDGSGVDEGGTSGLVGGEVGDGDGEDASDGTPRRSIIKLMRDDMELEQAAEETRQDTSPRTMSPVLLSGLPASTLPLPPPTPTTAGGAKEEDDEGGITSGGNDTGASPASEKSRSDRPKRDERPGARVSDPRSGFIHVKGPTNKISPSSIHSGSPAPTTCSRGRVEDDLCSPVAGAGKGVYELEADEMADEGEDTVNGMGVGLGGGSGRRRRVMGSRRTSKADLGGACYDSAGEWASDSSDDWAPLLASTSVSRRSTVGSTTSTPTPSATITAAATDVTASRTRANSVGSTPSAGRSTPSMLSKEAKLGNRAYGGKVTTGAVVGSGISDVGIGHGRKGEEDSDNDDGAEYTLHKGDDAVATKPVQAAGESAVEEDHNGEESAATGEGTAPPPAKSLPEVSAAPTPELVPDVLIPSEPIALSTRGRMDSAAAVDDASAPLSPPMTGVMSPSREALFAAAAARRKAGGGGGRGRGGIFDRIKMFEAAASESRRLSSGTEKPAVERRKLGEVLFRGRQALV